MEIFRNTVDDVKILYKYFIGQKQNKTCQRPKMEHLNNKINIEYIWL